MNPTELDRLARRVGIPTDLNLAVADRVQWMKLPGYALGTVEHVGPSGGATVRMDDGWRVLAPAGQFRPITPPAPPQVVTDALRGQHGG